MFQTNFSLQTPLNDVTIQMEYARSLEMAAHQTFQLTAEISTTVLLRQTNAAAGKNLAVNMLEATCLYKR